jgi:hypothetical protein
MLVDPSYAVVRRALGSGLVAAAIVGGCLTSAIAQQYQSDQPDEKAGRNRTAALGVARGTLNYATEREKVAEYFTKYYFPAMTGSDPESLGRLGDMRFDLFRRYLWASSNANFQSDLTNLAFNAMKGIAGKPYHPAVRYNAVLILGMLDEQYAIDSGANSRPPKPLPEANKLLTQIVAAGAAGNKAVTPWLMAGALVGLERHAQYRDGLPRDAIEPMTAAALKVVSQEKPVLDVSAPVYAWMRLQAANVLASLGAVGTNNQVHDALVKFVADGRTLDDRCAVAALTARIKYDGAKVDGKVAATTMLQLARELAEAEAKQAEEFRNLQLEGGGGFTGGGGGRMGRGGGGFRGEYGGSYSYTGEEEKDYPRRRVLARLTDLRAGLNTLKPVVDADAQAKFDAIIAAINPAIEATANEDTVSLTVAENVLSMSNAVNRITAPAGAAASAEIDAEEFEAPPETPAAPDAESPPAASPPAEAPAGEAVAQPAPAAPPSTPPASTGEAPPAEDAQ